MCRSRQLVLPLLCLLICWLASASAATDESDRLAALASSSENALQSGDIELAVTLAEKRLDLALGSSDGMQLARARLALGSLRRREGQMQEAADLFDAALPQLRAGNDPRALALALTARAQLHRNLGEYYESLELESQSLELRTAQSPPERPHISLFHLAALYEQMEDFDRALNLQYQALAAARESPDHDAEASALVRLSGLLNDIRADEPDEALGHASAALTSFEQQGNRPGMLDARFHIARAHLNAGRFEQAASMLDRCMTEAVALRQRSSQAHIQFRRAELELRRGNAEAARGFMLDAVQRYDALGNRHRLAKAHAMLAEIATALGEPDAAMRSRLEHFRLRDELLGAGATRRVNDLVERLRQSKEQARIEVLERDNHIQHLQLEQRRTSALLSGSLTLVVLLIALLLALRYRAAVVSNRLLAEKSRALAEQSSALVAANAQLAEQAEQLRRLANEDALTGLPNRGRGMQILRDALLQARSTGADLGVMILDIDHFKRFNDQYGHLAGDDVLRQITTLMRQHLCEDAIVARLGGEEFLGIIPRAERTLELAESIRRELEHLEIHAEGRKLRTTASVGVVRLSQLPQAELPDLLRTADQALYAAKRSGRNRVIVWPDFGDAKVIELHSA